MSKYTIEKHGKGYAIYLGRDWQHHGANIGHLTEVTPTTIKLIENALNTAAPSKPDVNQEMVDALQQWANGERFGDQEELDNARLSRNVILAKIKEENNG